MLREVERRMRRKGVLKVNAMVYAWNDPSLSDMILMGKALFGSKKSMAKRWKKRQ